MIKKYVLRKLSVYTLCLILIAMFYFLPTKQSDIENNNTINNKKETTVYLLDKDKYLSNVISYYDENSIEDLMLKKIEILTYGSEELNEFDTVIPSNTKVNSLKVEKDNVYIDFSKEILSIDEFLEDKMIESIVYSLTEVNGINNIYISVEKEKLLSLPSGKELPYPLTREYGINKEYDLNSLININKTVVYFIKSINNNKYYVPVTKVNNDNESKIEIIIKELKSSVNSQNNLGSNINDTIKLINYKIEDNSMILTFNKELNDDNKSLINKSIKENYKIDEVKYKVKK